MSSKAGSNGIGLGGVLFVVFLVMKLTDNIYWSWWWVTAPLWLPITVVFAFCGIAVLVMGLIELCKGK